ncbi:MAG: hypothetical protein EAZ09_22685 [Oscillatoriales cyanobacterium]|nr:MAG: hypothetical protein EAZ18_12445 [Oscillatoriales cyanobacterium]TAH15971.1 MAG: hypothetical protein EAZ09_22685 [Oscillatoriales cyanobacterium]
MAIPITGSLGQTTNFSTINDLIAKWATAAQNKGIKLSGIAVDGVETDYLNPTAIGNLTLATNVNPQSWQSYGSTGGIGVPSAYDGWFTDVNKVRAEINHNPNTNQSQALKVKWADNQDVTSATIDLSSLSSKKTLGVGDQGNEVGLMQVFNNGVLVPTSNFTFTRLNAAVIPKPLSVSANGVTFTGDRNDGTFQFKVEAKPLTGAAFDELRFSAKAYDSPTAAYLATPFKDDSSDYLVRSIQYQGMDVTPTPTPTPTPIPPSVFQFEQGSYTVNEGGVATINVTRTGGTAAASINYATVNGTARAGGTAPDYTVAAGALNFAAGQTSASFTVTALNDLLFESPETVNLVLSGGNIGSNPSILTINDVVPTPTPTPTPTPGQNTFSFSAAAYSVNEGSTAPITINRGGDLSIPATILFTTGDGTALGSQPDYIGVVQPVTFAPGQASAQVPVQTLFDSLTEPTETVNLFLSGGSLVGPSAAVLSIVDTTAVPPTFFSYGSSPGAIADGGAGTFTINRTGNTAVSAAIDFLIVAPGGPQPVNNVDYNIINPSGGVTPSGGTVNFNPGQTSVTLTMNNPLGPRTGVVNLGFGAGPIGAPASTAITLL